MERSAHGYRRELDEDSLAPGILLDDAWFAVPFVPVAWLGEV
ncbi:MAG: hypothetical protein V2A73_00820 [Pseudomonadota bacterium]